MNDEIFRDKQKFPISTMVFGAIGPEFKSDLIFPEGNIDSCKYQEMLEQTGLIKNLNEKYGFGKYIFMQDGAPANRSAQTLTRLRFQLRMFGSWPANSCDLNPIEHVWGLMKGTLAALEGTEFHLALITVWKSIPMDVINGLVEMGSDCAELPKKKRPAITE